MLRWMPLMTVLWMGAPASAETALGVVPAQAAVFHRANKAPVRAAAAAVNATAQYRYDSLGRLIIETYAGNAGTYTYDAAGNRTAVTAQ